MNGAILYEFYRQFKKLWRRIFVKKIRCGGYLTRNKPFDFGADPDQDQDPGIL